MPSATTASEWGKAVGYLPAVLDQLARDLVADRGVGVANAVTEALVTIRDLARSGRTHERDLYVRRDVQAVLRETLDEWELLRSYVAAEPQVEAGQYDEILLEAADSLAKASQHEPVGKPGGPGLWKHKGWQLPAYIQHIANDIRDKRGLPTSRAIAIAVAAVKKWARGGGKVDPGTRAAAQKALAEWEKLKAKAHTREAFDTATNAALVKSVDRLQHIVTPMQGQASFATRYAHRLTVIEGLLSALTQREPVRAIQTAAQFLDADERALAKLSMFEASLALSARLEEEQLVNRVLMESLGYGTTPKRATEPGHKGKFHGMHGVERAVRRRELIPAVADDEDRAQTPDERDGAAGQATEAAPWTEGLHPRASGGKFSSKGGPQQGQQDQGGQGGGQPSVEQQLDERLAELGYERGGKSLREFQQVNGLAATGKIDQPTVDALRQADPLEQVRKQTAASIQFGRANNTSALSAQRRQQLATDQVQAIGYPDSPSGLSQFQKDYGLPVTGSLDEKTLTTIATVYGNNARSANPKTPDFTGIAGAGARVKSRAQQKGARGGGKGTPAPPGRQTLGKSKLKAAIDALVDPDLVEVDTSVIGGTFDASLYGGPPSRVTVGEPTGTNHARDTTFLGPDDTRQPGGDDLDLAEPPSTPPGFREGSGNRVCYTCPHFSLSGRMGVNGTHIGACMLHSFPVLRLDVCDDWTTLSPPESNVRVFEAQLAEAERADDPEGVYVARKLLAKARAAAAESGELHPAHKDLAGLTVEEATFNPTQHPRGRGGKWIDVLGRMRHGDSVETLGFSVTRSAHGFEIKSPLKSETQASPRAAARRLSQLGAPSRLESATGPGLGGSKRMAPDEYFWNQAYKFELRDAPRAQQEEVARRFRAAGLKLDGASPKHSKIVAEVVAKKRSGKWQGRDVSKGALVPEREMGQLTDDQVQQLIDRISDPRTRGQAPEEWSKAVAREAHKRHDARRKATLRSLKAAEYDPLYATEAQFDPSRHPRGRGGKFRDVLGQLTALTPGHTKWIGGHQITRGFGKTGDSHEGVYARQFHGVLKSRGSAEQIAHEIAGTRPRGGTETPQIPKSGKETLDAILGPRGETAKKIHRLKDGESAKFGEHTVTSRGGRYHVEGPGMRPQDSGGHVTPSGAADAVHSAEEYVKAGGRKKKPGSPLSRRSGHDLLTEALALDDLTEGQIEFLTLQQVALEEGWELDEHLEIYVETLLEEAELTAAKRKNLSKSSFVFPDKAPGSGSYPIHDRAHGANALARSAGKPEHGAVKAAVCKRYPDLPECKGD